MKQTVFATYIVMMCFGLNQALAQQPANKSNAGKTPAAPAQTAPATPVPTSQAVVVPTYKYEAMSATGEEVKDVIDAASEDEAQQKIRQMGYFVTRLQEQAGKKTKGKKKAKTKAE